MIARLTIHLPFSLALPDKADFKLYSATLDGYEITILPPRRSGTIDPSRARDSMTLNGKPAFDADVLIIDFHKASFDRSHPDSMDPPHDLIREFVNNFLYLVRHITNSAVVRPLNFPHLRWSIRYLNDDESEPNKAEGLFRARGVSQFKFTTTAMTPEIWDAVHDASSTYRPPKWRDLLLDAQAALPDIGLVVVLASTSLEVFISDTLNLLANKGPVTKDWWDWVNHRDYLKNPSTEEQFSDLLKIFVGHSLKEDTSLWELFKNLRSARNSFVHEGTAKIGGVPVSHSQLANLLKSAWSVTDLVLSWLPSDLSQPIFKFDIKFQYTKDIWSASSPGGTGA